MHCLFSSFINFSNKNTFPKLKIKQLVNPLTAKGVFQWGKIDKFSFKFQIAINPELERIRRSIYRLIRKINF